MASTAAQLDAHAKDDGEVHAHLAPVKFYLAVFGALIFLTFLTVAVSYFDFGSANTIIALLIATMKASLVAAFFMHLTHDKLFNTICLVGAFFFLGIFYLFTYQDLGMRNEIDEENGATMLLRTGEMAPGGMPGAKPPSTETHGGRAPGAHGEPAPAHHP